MIAAAVLISPFVLAWIIYLMLRWQAATGLARTLGPGADPAVVAKGASALASVQMNQWGSDFIAFLLLMWFVVLIPVTWISFTAALPRREAIRTPRLMLRRARASDLDYFHAIFSDGEALRYWDYPPHGSVAETETWLTHLLSQPSETGDLFVIEREGRVIGMIGIWRWPWLSYILARDEWRKGYAAEALRAFLHYIFGRGVELITASTDQRNQASQALLRKFGFREYQRGEGRHPAKDEAYAFVAMRRDHPSWRSKMKRLSPIARKAAKAGPAAPQWA